jgi:tetratricopeptide (TPR) repeat protein
MAQSFFCHPERRELSQLIKYARFIASPCMTHAGVLRFGNNFKPLLSVNFAAVLIISPGLPPPPPTRLSPGKRNPKFVKAYNNRGIAYLGRQPYDLALADFNKAIELDPENGKVYNSRAVAYRQKGEIARARQDIQKAQSLGIPVNPGMVKKIMGVAP